MKLEFESGKALDEVYMPVNFTNETNMSYEPSEEDLYQTLKGAYTTGYSRTLIEK